MSIQRFAHCALPAIALSAALAGGGPAWAANGTNTNQSSSGRNVVALPPEGPPARVPLSGLAASPESTLAEEIDNPYAGQKQAIETGQQLFVTMNCADCHGFDAKGGMGPNLTGKYWRYGGTPADIFKSIYEGRPQGMPAWGRALPKQSIWMIVAYIQSLGGAFPPKYYQHALQGDRPGELAAPEIAFEQSIEGPPLPPSAGGSSGGGGNAGSSSAPSRGASGHQ
jgi:cytochrome c oxidase cbb3-type subunit 3